ncbi:MAG TPA: hypothetical protein VEA38_01635 [Terriglobales bacterium]|nr:hypothetical protein [Terriglobales bacterium]
MSAPTEVRLAGGQVGQGVHIYVGERLVLRYDGGAVESMETLRDEVAAARASTVAIRWLRDALKDLRAAGAAVDGTGSTEKTRKEAFAAGLEAGLLEENDGRKIEGAPQLAPEHPDKGRRAFERGWSLGCAMRRVVAIVDGGAQ